MYVTDGERRAMVGLRFLRTTVLQRMSGICCGCRTWSFHAFDDRNPRSSSQHFGITNNTGELTSSVSRVALKVMYLAVGSGTAACIQVACWMVPGERKAHQRIQGLYLKTLLSQKISFFDLETNTGEVIRRMLADTVVIQEAMGEKAKFNARADQNYSTFDLLLKHCEFQVGKFIQLVAMFVGRLVDAIGN